MLFSVLVRATAVAARASLKGQDGLGMGKGPNLWRSWSDGNLSHISVEAELGRPHDTVLQSFLEVSVTKSKKGLILSVKVGPGFLFLATYYITKLLEIDLKVQRQETLKLRFSEKATKFINFYSLALSEILRIMNYLAMQIDR